MPFREAYEITGQLVRLAESRQVALDELPPGSLASLSPHLKSDLVEVLAAPWEVPATGVLGGSSLASIERQAASLRDWLKNRI